MLSQEDLKKIIHYDPETGVITRIYSRLRAHVGKQSKSINAYGYPMTYIQGKHYLNHRLAWLYVYGEWPECEIDHINREKTDNKLSNLRKCVDICQNRQNRGKHKNNKSGFQGVCFSTRNKRNPWVAKIEANKVRKLLGYFATPEEASEAYQKAKANLHSA